MDSLVKDPFQVMTDITMPWVSRALEVDQVMNQFKRHLSPSHVPLSLNAIRVVRHKPGRRCLIEYDVALPADDCSLRSVTLIGKVRAKGLKRDSYRLLQDLWQSGFDTRSTDGISVPNPIGEIPPFRMWLQQKMPGETFTERLLAAVNQPDRVLCQQIAQAAHKIHQTSIPARRQHSLDDELSILQDRLTKVGKQFPQWQDRLNAILAGCYRIAATVPNTDFKPIHRDFYADQILVTADRLYLLDFDLFCYGDPALDIGNFIGHLSELSLRTFGNSEELVTIEKPIVEAFVALAGEQRRHAIMVYTLLTLVRHIYISTLFVDRSAFSESLIRLCEQRLQDGF